MSGLGHGRGPFRSYGGDGACRVFLLSGLQGCGAAFLGFRRFYRKHARLGWVSKGICLLGGMGFLIAGFSFLSTMRF